MAQLRNEAGRTWEVDTLREAIKEFNKDKTIWKISFIHDTTGIHHRLRPKHLFDLWGPDSESKMMALHADYKKLKMETKEDKNPDWIFWVDQKISVSKYLHDAYYQHMYNQTETDYKFPSDSQPKETVKKALTAFLGKEGKFISTEMREEIEKFVAESIPSLKYATIEAISAVDMIQAVHTTKEIIEKFDDN